MAEFLYSIDVEIFHFINGTLSNKLFDQFFPFITNLKNWYLLYIVLWFILLIKGGKIGKYAAFGIILVITVSDQISSNLLKNFFERIRPCNVLEDVNILVNCSKSYSFPSSHAVNNFAVAMYFYKLYPRLKWILFPAAFIVAFSRPYVGVHYPFDIFVGSLLGMLLGYIFANFTIRIYKYFSISKK